MKKDYPKEKLLSFETPKQFKVLYDLARFIELSGTDTCSQHFLKLTKYHEVLASNQDERMQKLHREFYKIKRLDYQFQIYLMLLERFMGQSLKEYDFLIEQKDQQKITHSFKIVCLLDSVRSAHNVGSMFRNADCFGVDKIELVGLTPRGDHPQVHKTAMGANELIPWQYHRSLEEALLNYQDYEIVAVETVKDGLSTEEWKPLESPILLMFGHEQFGLSLDALKRANSHLSIPLFGIKNSLNVAVSQGIILNTILSKLQTS